jgi:hypothetical protein
VWGVYTTMSLWSAGSDLRGILELAVTAAVVVVAIGVASTMNTVARLAQEVPDLWWSLREMRSDRRA